MCAALAVSVGRQSTRGSVLVLMLVVVLAIATTLMQLFPVGEIRYQFDLRTRKQLVDAREALVGFALANGRLPRPARSALDGRERPDACETENDCSGLLPWVSLGLTPLDGWGHLLHYSVTPEMTRLPVSREAVPNKVVLRRDIEGNELYLAGQDTCSQAQLCSPAVVFSAGPAGGISASAILQPGTLSQNPIAAHNFAAYQRFFLPGVVKSGSAPPGPQLIWLDGARLLRSMDDARQLH